MLAQLSTILRQVSLVTLTHPSVTSHSGPVSSEQSYCAKTFIVQPSNIKPGAGGVGSGGKVKVPPYVHCSAAFDTVNCVSPLYQLSGTVLAVHCA